METFLFVRVFVYFILLTNWKVRSPTDGRSSGDMGRVLWNISIEDKLLNVRDASIDQIMNNDEINNIKKILGLQHGVEYDNTSKLTYGHTMLMMD